MPILRNCNGSFINKDCQISSINDNFPSMCKPATCLFHPNGVYSPVTVFSYKGILALPSPRLSTQPFICQVHTTICQGNCEHWERMGMGIWSIAQTGCVDNVPTQWIMQRFSLIPFMSWCALCQENLPCSVSQTIPHAREPAGARKELR